MERIFSGISLSSVKDKDFFLLIPILISVQHSKRWEEKDVEPEGSPRDRHPCMMGRRCKDRFLIRKGGKVACLDCGKFGQAQQGPLGKWRRRWLQEPCAGEGKMPKPLRDLYNAGGFDLPGIRTDVGWVQLGEQDGVWRARLVQRPSDAKVYIAR